MKSATVVFVSLILGSTGWTPVQAQQYVISTFAGGGAPLVSPTPALTVPLGYFGGIGSDPAGNIYIGNQQTASIFKLDQNGVLSQVAGNGQPGYSGDGGPANDAQLNSPIAVAVDQAGNLLIAEYGRIRRVSPGGIITTVAGNGSQGFSGDGGPATDAQIAPRSLAVDNSGNLFIAESTFRIRKVTPAGIISTIAGNGNPGLSGDGGAATDAQLSGPNGVAVDVAGNVFISGGPVVRMVSSAGIISTFAGSGACCTMSSGDGGPATKATLNAQAIAVDAAGNVFIGDANRVRKVTSDGIINTVVGNGTWGYSGDGEAATAAQINYAAGLTVDGKGNLFIDDGQRVRMISTAGIITTVAGNGRACCLSGDGGPATSAQLSYPSDVAVDTAGNVFIADTGNGRIRRVWPDGTISTVTANGQGWGLSGLAVDSKGTLLMVDTPRHVVRRVALDGSSTVVAGNGAPGPSGDGGPATSAQLAWPTRVTTDRSGNIFIMDNGGTRIRKVSPDGIITTVAGTSGSGYFYGGFAGDGGPAVNAQLDTDDGCDGPGGGMAVDVVGDLYFADTYNNRIRQIDPNGIIHTVAGNGSWGFSGDGGPLNNAVVSEPFSLTFDPAGNLFIADFGNGRVRMVTPDAVITTVAGTGSWAYSGDGGLGAAATLRGPSGIAADGSGNIYVADAYNNAVRVLRPTNLTALIKTVVDAASQRADPLSPGKLVTIYGYGLGPSQLTQNPATGGLFGTDLSGTSVSFNGIAAPVLYTSERQVGAVVPYAVTGTSAQVVVKYQGQVSNSITLPVAVAAPRLFTRNQTGAGEAVAINMRDGTANSAVNPVKVGDVISLFVTGAGQTVPAGVDGQLSSPGQPLLPLSATVGGIPATVQSKAGAPGQVAGVMQVTLQIPSGVQPGGYVPVVLKVGDASSTDGAAWIAVAGN